MPCYRCGARQTDPVRGSSPWKRGVRHESQVLICPDCQRAPDLDLDTCATCGATTLICRLGDIECRTCGTVRPATRTTPDTPLAPATAPTSDLSEEVAAALARVLGRHPRQ